LIDLLAVGFASRPKPTAKCTETRFYTEFSPFVGFAGRRKTNGEGSEEEKDVRLEAGEVAQQLLLAPSLELSER
jgi:hypothetical protein